MKQRIAIVVLGLLLGLAARVAVESYQRYQTRRAPSPPTATATPLRIKSEPGK